MILPAIVLGVIAGTEFPPCPAFAEYAPTYVDTRTSPTTTGENIRTVNSQDWLDAAFQSLCARYGHDVTGKQIHLALITTRLLPQVADVKTLTVTPGLAVDGRIPIDLTAQQTNGTSLHFSIWFRCSTEGEFWVYTRDIPARTIVSSEMIEKRALIVAGLPVEQRLDMSPAGKYLLMNVRKNGLVNTHQLGPVPLVTRFRSVPVLISVQGIRIQTKGVAQSDGFTAGENISVIVSGATEATNATLMANGELNVSE